MDGVKFSLAEMENTYLQASNDQETFSKSIDEINKIVNELSSVWTSDETNTYETFKQLFNEKYPALVEGNEMMKTFCSKIQEKKEDFQEAAQRSINMFN